MYKPLSACQWSGLTRHFIYMSKERYMYLSPTTSLLLPPKIAVILNVHSRKVPHSTEQLSPCTTVPEPVP